MTKPVQIKFKNKATGKMETIKCHNPATCREHAWLARSSETDSTKVFADFHGQATYENEDSVSLDVYNNDSIVNELYDSYTLKVDSNASAAAEGYTSKFPFSPKDGSAECEKCGNEVEHRVMKWENDQYNGREQVWVHKGKPELDFFSNVSLNRNLHIEGDGKYQNQPTGDAHHVHPKSWCSSCGTVGSIVVDRDMWADNFSCANPECDFEVRHSLGD